MSRFASMYKNRTRLLAGTLLALVISVGWTACATKPALFRYCKDTTPEQESELKARCQGDMGADCHWHYEYDRDCGLIERREQAARPWWRFW